MESKLQKIMRLREKVRDIQTELISFQIEVSKERWECNYQSGTPTFSPMKKDFKPNSGLHQSSVLKLLDLNRKEEIVPQIGEKNIKYSRYNTCKLQTEKNQNVCSKWVKPKRKRNFRKEIQHTKQIKVEKQNKNSIFNSESTRQLGKSTAKKKSHLNIKNSLQFSLTPKAFAGRNQSPNMKMVLNHSIENRTFHSPNQGKKHFIKYFQDHFRRTVD